MRKMAGALGEAAEWKRVFFAAGTFETVEDLVQSAIRGEDAAHSVEAFLKLSHRRVGGTPWTTCGRSCWQGRVRTG